MFDTIVGWAALIVGITVLFLWALDIIKVDWRRVLRPVNLLTALLGVGLFVPQWIIFDAGHAESAYDSLPIFGWAHEYLVAGVLCAVLAWSPYVRTAGLTLLVWIPCFVFVALASNLSSYRIGEWVELFEALAFLIAATLSAIAGHLLGWHLTGPRGER